MRTVIPSGAKESAFDLHEAATARALVLHAFFLVILFFISSCSPAEHLTPEELAKYIRDEDHGLLKSVESNGTEVEVTFRPTDLLVQQELENATDTASVNKLRKKYSAYYYFILSLSKDNKEALHQAGDMGTYSELVQTMSFRMTEYVTLTTSALDTIQVGDFMLNRTFGMSASTDILFVFNKAKAKDKEWVQFNLNEFGLGVGNQRFRFSTHDLENVPKIYKN